MPIPQSAENPPSAPGASERPSIARWGMLLLLCAIYALSIADRYAMSTVLEPVRADLKLSDSGIAFLTGTALAIFYVAFGIPLSWLADRWHRVRIIALSILAWSAMTAWTGLARNFSELVASRIGVGVGEAGATPAASSLIADRFTAEERPMALTLFSLGAPVGAWIASTVGGSVAQHWGWRSMFLVLAVPGVLLGCFIAIIVPEGRRGAMDDSTPRCASAPSIWVTWRYMLGHRATVHLLAAVALSTLWGWGLMWWMPAFLSRSYGLDVGAAGALLGRQHLAGGVTATLCAAWIFSRPRIATTRSITRILAIVVALGSALSVALLITRSMTMTTRLLWAYVPIIYLSIGPTMALLNNFVPARMRAVALATSLLFANVCNLVIAPQLVGYLSDLYSTGAPDGESLRQALLWLTPTGGWAALHFFWCGRASRDPVPSR